MCLFHDFPAVRNGTEIQIVVQLNKPSLGMLYPHRYNNGIAFFFHIDNYTFDKYNVWMKTTRIFLTVYLFALAAMLILIGSWPLTPVGAPLFMLVAILALIGAFLMLVQSPNAIFYIRKILNPVVWAGWIFFTGTILFKSVSYHPEPSFWSELIFNFFVCSILAVILLPLFLFTRKDHFLT